MLFLAFWCGTRNKHTLRNMRKEGEIWQFLCFGLLTESRCQGRNRWENWPISVQQPGSVIVSVQFLTGIRGEYVEKVLYIIINKFLYIYFTHFSDYWFYQCILWKMIVKRCIWWNQTLPKNTSGKVYFRFL